MPLPPLTVDFSALNSVRDVAVAIGCSEALVERAINNRSGRSKDIKITTADGEVVFELPGEQELCFPIDLRKKNPRRPGERRRVWVVQHQEFANAQKALLRRLYDYLSRRLVDFPSSSAHGYVRGRSIVTNAAAHLGARVILSSDIKDFFPSISLERVSASLLGAGLSPSAAEILARFVTIDGKLPLGLNASPLIANLVCRELDAAMSELACRLDCAYTRYADDFTFSSNERLPTRQELATIVEGQGFELSDKKFRVSKRGQRHYVTGLSVADEKQPRLRKKFKRRLRQELYYCAKFGIDSHGAACDSTAHQVVNRIDGRIAYVRGIEPDFGRPLRQKWTALLEKERLSPRYPSSYQRAPNDVLVVFDESELKTIAGPLFCMCCVTIEDPEGVRKQVQDLFSRHMADPFSPGRKPRMAARGFHYTDDPEDVRTTVIKLLAELPIRGFLAYGSKPETLSYAKAYHQVFGWLLKRRFFAADRRVVHVMYEENPSVGHNELNALMAHLYFSLDVSGARRPRDLPTLRRATKAGEPLLALPDYLLGVFGAYALSETVPARQETVTKRFERLRDRFRLIGSLNDDVHYSRHHPFRPWPGGDPRASVVA